MGRTTIDFGIDLGTTNSEIACMDKGELVVVKNMVTSNEVTPSVVRVDARGTVVIGQNAYNELEYDPENTVGEFKRWMGNPSHDGFMFQRSRRRMTASALSAEVLKALKASASSRFGGEEVESAVITVPAMFLIPACEDTKAAAKLAGINNCPLLQEPVAAAIAYGYRAENLTGNLLVFDLGGGTFDTSLLTARDGRLVVVGHDGDDKLGGKDYDWALVDVIVRQLTLEYGARGFSRDGSARRAMAKLKYLAEDAKKSLSLLNEVAVEVKRLEGEFEDIDTVVQLSRRDLETTSEHLTGRCMSVCRRLLKDARTTRDDLAGVLVVGGQTKTPYIRDAVASEFGKADFRLDPMIVVATGAALFAATQRIPTISNRQLPRGETEVKVAYSPVSTDLDAEIGIAVTSVVTGMTVTVIRGDGGWSTGAAPVPVSGKIFTTVVLRAKRANSFEIQLRDASGTLVRTNNCNFTITHGLATAQATTSQSLLVALANNEAHVLIPKNSPLPAKGVQKFVTTHEVRAGDSKSILNIFILEGNSPRSDRNWGIGVVQLRGDELRRTLPAGESVEVNYRLDDSKTLSAEAIFPSLREARQMVYVHERPALSSEEIGFELRKERERISKLESAAPEKVGPKIGQQIELLEREKDAACDDPDSQQKAAQRLIELKQAVDALELSSEWEILIVDLEEYRGSTEQVIQANGTPEQHSELPLVIKAADIALAERNSSDLRRAVERLKSLYWEVSFAQNDFWKAQFLRLVEGSEFVDPLKAEQLKEEGLRALKRDDVSSLRTIVWDLYRLLPSWQDGKIDNQFDKAGIKLAHGQSS